jgi:hypothetical protein
MTTLVLDSSDFVEEEVEVDEEAELEAEEEVDVDEVEVEDAEVEEGVDEEEAEEVGFDDFSPESSSLQQLEWRGG